MQTEVCFVCQFVDEKANGSYPFENGLNGLPIISTDTPLQTIQVVKNRPPKRGDQVPKCSMYGKATKYSNSTEPSSQVQVPFLANHRWPDTGSHVRYKQKAIKPMWPI